MTEIKFEDLSDEDKILSSTNRKPKLLIDSFNEYIRFYKFTNVSELIIRFKKY